MTQAAQLAQYGANNVGLSFKNRIINGDMTIAQRATSATAGDGTYPSIDRYQTFTEAADGVFTVAQITDAPSGFTNSARITVNTADASIGAGQRYLFMQNIEGFNVADLAYGTASAQTITVSFWVKSSLTGTFSGSLNASFAPSYPFTYTINSANTWEYKTITIIGSVTGTWNTTNGVGLRLNFCIGAGSNSLGTANTWSTGSSFFGATGSVQLISTVNATWQITGVQLEKGSVATSFDYLPYGTELMLCQRYYETSYPIGFSAGHNFGQQYPFSTSKPVAVNLIASDDTTSSQSVRFVVNKRTSPTVTIYSADNGASGFSFTYKGTGGTAINVSASVIYTSENLWNIGQSLGAVNQANESYFHFAASAEL
jgi:hypothetical protein